MTGLIAIVILGGLVLAFATRLLVQSGGRRKTQGVTIEDYSEARAALDLVFEETAAIKRILSSEDREFISQGSAPEVQRLFLEERKRMAIQWLRMTRKQVARLMGIHLKLAGYTYEPNTKFEFRLTVNYWRFVVGSNALLILLWLRGPFETTGIACSTLRMAEHFSAAFSLRLEETDPQKLGTARGSSLA